MTKTGQDGSKEIYNIAVQAFDWTRIHKPRPLLNHASLQQHTAPRSQ